MWFQTVFGAAEADTFQKSQNLFLYDNGRNILTSIANNTSFDVGPFEIISSAELSERIQQVSCDQASSEDPSTWLTFENIIGDARTLIKDPYNHGSVFQVASQFNCLEMSGPKVTPDTGITNYCKDPTQGPACAITCPAATVFRNYFYNGCGQNKRQIDMLARVGQVLNNDSHQYWVMKNGYCLPVSPTSMGNLAKRLQSSPDLYQAVLDASCVGVHWDTEVTCAHSSSEYSSLPSARSSTSLSLSLQNQSSSTTTSSSSTLSAIRSKSIVLPAMTSEKTSDVSYERTLSTNSLAVSMSDDEGNMVECLDDTSMLRRDKLKVCQVFTSALPVAYAKSTPSKDWAPFACAVLEAAFDNTLTVANLLNINERRRLKQQQQHDNSTSVPVTHRIRVFVTCVGGGAFGNRLDWIISSLGKALVKHRHESLDVKLVHYDGIIKSVFNTINLAYRIPVPEVVYKESRRRWHAQLQSMPSSSSSVLSRASVSVVVSGEEAGNPHINSHSLSLSASLPVISSSISTSSSSSCSSGEGPFYIPLLEPNSRRGRETPNVLGTARTMDSARMNNSTPAAAMVSATKSTEVISKNPLDINGSNDKIAITNNDNATTEVPCLTPKSSDYDEFAMDDNETICSYISKCSIGLTTRVPATSYKLRTTPTLLVSKKKRLPPTSMAMDRRQLHLRPTPAFVRLPPPSNQVEPISAQDRLYGISFSAKEKSMAILMSNAEPGIGERDHGRSGSRDLVGLRPVVSDELSVPSVLSVPPACRGSKRNVVTTSTPIVTLSSSNLHGSSSSVNSHSHRFVGILKLDDDTTNNNVDVSVVDHALHRHNRHHRDIPPADLHSYLQQSVSIVGAQSWLKMHASAVAKAGRPDWANNFNVALRPNTSQSLRDVDMPVQTRQEGSRNVEDRLSCSESVNNRSR